MMYEATRSSTAGEQERERVAQHLRELGHGSGHVLAAMRPKASSAKFAERTLRSVDENRAEERIVVWIERRRGAVWAVGRAVNPQHRSSDAPRPRRLPLRGYELEDALEVANGTAFGRLAGLGAPGRTGGVDRALRPRGDSEEARTLVLRAHPGAKVAR